ncbi:MAG TPA: hypothetical protein DCQ86_06145 [Succinivibrio sp.]|nr:hypothetical protein [Succinivibrio sp.]
MSETNIDLNKFKSYLLALSDVQLQNIELMQQKVSELRELVSDEDIKVIDFQIKKLNQISENLEKVIDRLCEL